MSDSTPETKPTPDFELRFPFRDDSDIERTLLHPLDRIHKMVEDQLVGAEIHPTLEPTLVPVIVNEPVSVQVSVLCGSERDRWINPYLMSGLLQAAKDERFKVVFMPGYPSIHPQTSQEARNDVTEIFLAGNSTWLLMIDNDTKLTAGQKPMNPLELCLSRNFSGVSDLAKYHIVAAPIPVLQGDNCYINVYAEAGPTSLRDYRSFTRHEYDDWAKGDSLLSVFAVGSGCIAIHRKVIEAIHAADPPVWQRPRRPDGHTEEGEDLNFCRRARGQGFTIYASRDHLCGHFHSIDLLEVPGQPLTFHVSETDYGFVRHFEMITATDWSITPDIATLLRDIIANGGGRRVLEFGSGISTQVIHHEQIGACNRVQSDGLRQGFQDQWSLFSIEEDPSYAGHVAQAVAKMMAPTNVQWGTVKLAAPGFIPPTPPPINEGSYLEAVEATITGPYDLVLIDGPRVEVGNERMGLLPLAWKYLAVGGVIIVDDLQRGDYYTEFIDFAEDLDDQVKAAVCNVGKARRIGVMVHVDHGRMKLPAEAFAHLSTKGLKPEDWYTKDTL